MSKLELEAELQLPDLLHRVDGLGRRMTNLQDLLNTPRLVPIVSSIVGINGQLAGVNVAGPEGGLEWHVRRITLAPTLQSGLLQSVTTQGTIIIGRGTGLAYSGNAGGQVIATGSANFQEITRTATVPNALLFSRGQCAINYPDNLIVLWASGTDKLTLSITGDALEVPQNLSSPDEA